MIKSIKRRWLRAQTLSVLQIHYGLPLKEPLEGLPDFDLQTCVDTMLDTGGNEWDAAAGYIYVQALGIVAAQVEVRDADLDMVRHALSIMATAPKMKKADSLRPLVKSLIERWKAHPDHPSKRA